MMSTSTTMLNELAAMVEKNHISSSERLGNKRPPQTEDEASVGSALDFIENGMDEAESSFS